MRKMPYAGTYCRECFEECFEKRDEEQTECYCCAKTFEAGTLHMARSNDYKKYYCDECWEIKIEEGRVFQDEDGEWGC